MMKRTIFAIAVAILAFSGCNFGQTNTYGRPGFFQRIHNRIHGTNVGAPCVSGMCSAPMAQSIAPPAMASAGCETCGPSATMGYESYDSGNAYLGNSESYVNGGDTYVGSTVPQTYGAENVIPVPAR